GDQHGGGSPWRREWSVRRSGRRAAEDSRAPRSARARRRVRLRPITASPQQPGGKRAAGLAPRRAGGTGGAAGWAGAPLHGTRSRDRRTRGRGRSHFRAVLPARGITARRWSGRSWLGHLAQPRGAARWHVDLRAEPRRGQRLYAAASAGGGRAANVDFVIS